ncbi:lamin tail domain-containing protein [Halorubrum distributum]|uniref:DUF4350 domain-containing protein n=1 Tax=Halorubrum distributum TaxID=29283 RepID=UPI002952F2ED|nr:DUF4350 domain-containing protein [Halorubrum distributum]MDV7348732.1 lamin tail domain-containing protein [Halorubrum distributum]
MKRRSVIIGLGATAAGGGAIATGAFDTASAERDATVALADDASSLLSLTPLDDEFAFVDDSGELALVFDEVEGGGTGFGSGTVYEVGEVFQVSNQGTEDLGLFATVDDGAIGDAEFALTVDGEELGPDPTVELDVGEAVAVGVEVDAGDDPTDGEVAITIGVGDGPIEDPGDGPGDAPTEFVDQLMFDSTASLLAENGYLPSEAIAVAAEPTAQSTDADGNDDATTYPDDEPLPLMAVDQNLPVVAFGFPFAQDDGVTFGQYGNEEVLLNVLDEYADSETVLWDEGHGQFYDLASHSGFEGYAEENGYDVAATTDLESDLLGPASAIVITSPSESFSGSEITALDDFADAGGLIVLMDQSDFDNFDATDNLNALASGIDTQIRFNDNQVIDSENNAGSDFVPTTTDLDTENYPGLFADREGLGLELDPNEEYDVEIVSVADGDTADVEFSEGQVESIRILGIDTPETGDTEERLQEYEGIDDAQALKDKGDEATTYAENQLEVGSTVTLSFDENEGLRGNFGRLLGFLELPNGDVYNAKAVEDGWARVYDSGLANHDAYWDLERAARDAGDGIWEISDVEATPVVGDEPVDELFVPFAASVATADGAIAGDRVPVAAEGGDPLVGVDEANNVALLGGPLPAESFESDENDEGLSTEPYGNYVFLTNLIDAVSADGREGSVVIDGGHGQFAADYALSAEDAAYFQRYLEGFAIEFDGKNDFDDDLGRDLAEARAVIVTAPDDEFGSDEVAAIEDFRDDGGAVILASAGAGTDDAADARDNLDALAADLGSDLRTGDAVTDEENNLGGPENPTTTNFDTDFDLFGAYGDGDDGGDGGSSVDLAVDELVADPEGDQTEDEYVSFVNQGDETVDLDGYVVDDEVDNSYTFSGVSADPGATITLYTGSGNDTDDTVYWGRGSPVWNNGGDTVFVTDPDGNTVVEYSY